MYVKASPIPFLNSQTLQCAFCRGVHVGRGTHVCTLDEVLRFGHGEFPEILEQSYDLTHGRSLVNV